MLFALFFYVWERVLESRVSWLIIGGSRVELGAGSGLVGCVFWLLYVRSFLWFKKSNIVMHKLGPCANPRLQTPNPPNRSPASPPPSSRQYRPQPTPHPRHPLLPLLGRTAPSSPSSKPGHRARGRLCLLRARVPAVAGDDEGADWRGDGVLFLF